MRALTQVGFRPLPDWAAAGAIICHDVRDPRARRNVLYRKGMFLTEADLARLARLAVGAVHVLVRDAGNLPEDAADIVFDGLRRVGGSVDQIGIPIEPGTACWIRRLGDRPVLGVASCELFGRAGAVDVLLPHVLPGVPLDRALMRELAHGGLLLGGPSRLPAYRRAAPGPVA